MTAPLRVLIIEDTEDDAFLEVRELQRHGFVTEWRRVDSREATARALAEESFDAVLCDWGLPGFAGVEALELVNAHGVDIPFILVSGAIGEEATVDAMRSGAHDLVSKERLWRLGPAIERELREAAARKARRRTEEALYESQRIAHIGNWIWSIQENAFEGSDEMFRIAGLEPQQEPRMGLERLMQLFASSSHGPVREMLGKIAAGAPAEVDVELVRPDGTHVFAHGRGEPEPTASGPPLRAFGYLQDITERKKAEMALRSSQEMLAAAQRIAHLGTFSYNIRTGENRLTDETFRIFGRDPESFAFDLETYLSQVHPEDRGKVEHAVSNAIAGNPYTLQYRIVRPDGEVRVLQDTAELVFDDAGEPFRIVGTTQDVTETRLLERQVLEAERRYRRVVDGANDLIFTTNSEGVVTSVNPTIEKIGGWKPEDVIGKSFAAFMEPDEVPRALERMAAVAEGGEPEATVYHARTKWGGTIVLESRLSADVCDGRFEGFIVIARDITERKRAEEEREALAREIELLLESTYEGIYATDVTGRCTLVNRAACTMLGWDASDLIGKDLHAIKHHHRADGSPYPFEECPLLSAADRTQQLRIADETFWRRDGTSFPVEVLASPIFDSDSTLKGLVVSFTDQSEKKLLRGELERAERVGALGRVAATMSHEFNNVLMGIQPWAEMILRDPASDRVIASARSITQSVQRGRRVTEEILSFSRPSEPAKASVDVAAFLSDCGSQLRVMLPGNVALDLDAPAPLTMGVDPNQIAQVVTNIVINARDAIGHSPGRITVRATACDAPQTFPFGVLSGSGSYVHISITDDGPGIPREKMAQVFEPFFTTKKGGTGLGLAVAHQIVTLHGGHIFAESGDGLGTTMHLFIPASTAPAASETKVHVEWTRREATVLIVEDEETISTGLSILLESEGLKAIVAATASEAIRLLSTVRPDALVIDVGLPDADGVDLYEQIVATHGRIPTIFSSGHADRAHIRSSFEGESVRFLMKPYALETLLAEMEKVLAAGAR